MARLTKRTSKQKPQPLSDQATGDWYTKKGERKRYQRYDEAPPNDGTVHWYKQDGGPWRAFRTSDVKKSKPPKTIKPRRPT